jgi:hypothetical protein
MPTVTRASKFVVGLLAFFVSTQVLGDDIVTWTNATTNTDTTAIPATGPGSLATTTIQKGTCVSGAFGTQIATVTLAATIKTNTFVGANPPGSYCFRGFHTAVAFPGFPAQSSAMSGTAIKLVNPPVPSAPGALMVSADLTAYTFVKQDDYMVMSPVGDFPPGTMCIEGFSVTAIPVGQVTAITYTAVPHDTVKYRGLQHPKLVFGLCS